MLHSDAEYVKGFCGRVLFSVPFLLPSEGLIKLLIISTSVLTTSPSPTVFPYGRHLGLKRLLGVNNFG